MKRLIVTADDFGAAIEVNEAVERAHRNGILSAASLMVAGAAAGDAVTRAKTMPELRVGLHLVLVEGRPILPRDAVPDLVDATGHFRTDMARAGAAMFFFPKVRAQLAAEIEELRGRVDSLLRETDHLRGILDGMLHANEALLRDLSRIPRWTLWLCGVDLSD